VAEAAVAGVQDERWGERVTAWVVLRDGQEFDEAVLIAHARTLLAAYKCPKRVFRLAALPRNQLGKIVAAPWAEPHSRCPGPADYEGASASLAWLRNGCSLRSQAAPRLGPEQVRDGVDRVAGLPSGGYLRGAGQAGDRRRAGTDLPNGP